MLLLAVVISLLIRNKRMSLYTYRHRHTLSYTPHKRTMFSGFLCEGYLVQSQSQTYFTTGGLPPISSSRRQAPWDSRPVIFLPQLNTCVYSPYITSSLTRGWVCRLQSLLVLGSVVILRSESSGTYDHITVSDSRLHQSGGPGPRIYIPPEQGGLVIPPGTGFPFRRLLRLAGLLWRYSSPPPHWIVCFIFWRSLLYCVANICGVASSLVT
jgi:hypothetical protein